MHETTVEIDGRQYWVSTINGEVISKELVPERYPNMSEPRESVFLIDDSGNEHSVEMEVLTSEFRSGSTISLIYLSNRESRPGKLGLVYNHDTRKMSGDWNTVLYSVRRRYSRPLLLLAASLSCAAVVYFGSRDHPVIAALLALATIPASAAILFVIYMNSSYFTSGRDRRRMRAFLDNNELLRWITRAEEPTTDFPDQQHDTVHAAPCNLP